MASYKFSKDQNNRVKIRRQTEYYNRVFTDWRKDNSHSVGFYPEKTKELSYTDTANSDMEFFTFNESHGSERRAEFGAFRRSLSFIGILMFLATAIIFLYQLFLPMIIGFVNPQYTYDYFGGMIYHDSGSFTFSLIIGGIGTFAVYAIIIAVGIRILRIPLSVVFPTTIISSKLTVAAFPTALSLAVFCIFYRDIVHIPEFTLTTGVSNSVLGTIFRYALYIIIIPLLSELAFRGVLLQFLRQFGDVSAVIISAILSSVTACAVMGGNMLGLTTNTPISGTLAAFPITLLCALCYGYFTISSGTILIPIAMKMLIAVCNILHMLFISVASSEVSVFVNSISACILFFGCVAMLINVICRNSDEIELQNNQNFLSTTDKLFCITSPGFLLPVILLIFTMFIPK
jgi:membrane protease YdiL (CAAX protease family)